MLMVVLGGAMKELPTDMPVAAYRGAGNIVVETRPVPSPEPECVLIEIDRCGICGTDIHMLLEGWSDKPGSVAGHEWTGTIVALGDGVTDWNVGEPVVGGMTPKCGFCRRCQEGKPSQCENRTGRISDSYDGAFARYKVAPIDSLLRMPDGLNPRSATLAEPLAVALHAITQSGITADDSAMIIGAGPIGALTLAVLRHRGIGPITVIEPSQPRRDLALQLGAQRVAEPSDLEIFPSWEPEHIVENPVSVVFECSGKKAAMEAGFHQLRRGGVLVLVGSGIEHPSFDPNRLILNELQIIGSFIYDKCGFEDALTLLSDTSFTSESILEPEDVSLTGLGDALVNISQGRVAGKVLVAPWL